MKERKPSLHMVTVFDPNKDPSVADMLTAERRMHPKVVSIFAPNRLGLITSKNGTFWIDSNGDFKNKTVDKCGCRVIFRRSFDDGTQDANHFATAVYTLEECLACATGEVVRLDEFIERSAFGDINFDVWERELSKT